MLIYILCCIPDKVGGENVWAVFLKIQPQKRSSLKSNVNQTWWSMIQDNFLSLKHEMLEFALEKSMKSEMR